MELTTNMTFLFRRLMPGWSMLVLWIFTPALGQAQTEEATQPQCIPCKECPPCAPAAPDNLDQDMNLLSALQDVVSPDAKTRLNGVRNLEQLKDQRAAAALIHTLRYDGMLQVQIAAAKALANYPSEQSSKALSNTVGRLYAHHTLRVQAAQSLGQHQGDNAFSLLWDARDDEDEDVARAIKTTLRENFPKRYQEHLLETPVLDQQGRWYLVGPMAVHGSIFMTALASLAGGEPGAASIWGGATVGGLTPYLLTIDSNMPRSEALWLDSTITWGLLGGLSSYGALSTVAQEKGALWSMVGGQAVGLTAGLLTHKDISFSWGDTIFMNASGLAGTMTAGSWLLMADNDERQAVSATLGGGFAAGVLTSSLITKELEFSKGDAAAIAGLTGFGTLFSAGIPQLLAGEFEGDGEFSEGSMLLGGGLSFAGATALSQYYEPTTTDVAKASISSLWGYSIGNGLAQISTDSDHHRAAVALPMAGALGGLLAASLGDDDTRFQRGDYYATAVGMIWGSWQGEAAGHVFYSDLDGDPDSSRERRGSLALGFGLGGFAGAGVGKYFDPTPMDVMMASSVGVWGGWLAGWSAHVLDKHGSDISGKQMTSSVLIGSDVGLATGTLLLSSVVKLPAERLGWINAAGLLGMGIGSSFSAIFSDYVAEGNVLGTTAGLLTGTFITSSMDFAPPTQANGIHAKKPGPWDNLIWWPTAAMVPDEEGRAHLQFGVAGFY